eukprot:6812176-Prymnesium_polylepis.1
MVLGLHAELACLLAMCDRKRNQRPIPYLQSEGEANALLKRPRHIRLVAVEQFQVVRGERLKHAKGKHLAQLRAAKDSQGRAGDTGVPRLKCVTNRGEHLKARRRVLLPRFSKHLPDSADAPTQSEEHLPT